MSLDSTSTTNQFLPEIEAEWYSGKKKIEPRVRPTWICILNLVFTSYVTSCKLFNVYEPQLSNI